MNRIFPTTTFALSFSYKVVLPKTGRPMTCMHDILMLYIYDMHMKLVERGGSEADAHDDNNYKVIR